MFQAASSGRGSAVTMTVSSMSETMPKLDRGIDDEDGRLDGFRLVGAHGDGVPARRQVGVEHRVDHAAAVGGDPMLDARRSRR